jgi:hypothetical protein
MKTNGKHEVIAGIARQSLVLAALLAMVLSAASISQAQSSAIPAAAPAVKPAAAPAKAPALPTAKPPAKGQQQGITVSGRWVIEVRNPDGKVTAHTEFENAIQPAGMVYLAALLAGHNAPGQLSIMLNGGDSQFCAGNCTYVYLETSNYFSSSAFGPCGSSAEWANTPFIDGVNIPVYGGEGVTGTGPCIITAAANSTSYASVLSAACAYYSAEGEPYCSTNLTTTAPTITASNFGNGLSASFTLGGTIVASYPGAGGYITDVETIFETCSNSSTPAGCTGFWDSKTGKAKTGMTWEGMNLFTEANLASPGVAYIPGQTLSATVTFTFSSPSS